MKLKNFFTKVALGLLSVCALVLVAVVSPITASAEGEPTIVTTEAELTSALATGGNIKLGADITATAHHTIAGGKTVILDLSGYTLDMGSNYITNNGTLELRGETGGEITGNSYRYVIENYGSFTITSGTVSNTNGELFTDVDAGIYNWESIVINSEGAESEVFINGGTVNGAKVGIVNEGSFTINDGAVIATSDAIYNWLGGVTINGGEIRGGTGIQNEGGNVEMTGGTITASYGIVYFAFAGDTVTLSGGTIDSRVAIDSYDGDVADCLVPGYIYYKAINGEVLTLTEGQKAISNWSVTIAPCQNHIGGTATCDTLAVCELCKLEYGTYYHPDAAADGFCDVCSGLLIIEATFPDATFRTYITEKIDTDKDGALSSEEIAAVTEIDVSIEASYSYTYISDLTGIEYFTNLVTLKASGTNIASIDVSAFTKLEFLYLYNCHYLKTLDLTANTNLIDLDVSGTGITELDLSNNSNAGLNMGENTSVVTLEHCGVGYVDMSQFADLSRMTIVSGGTLGSDGWLKLDVGATEILYEYDTKSNPHIAAYFYVEIYINSNNVAHAYVDAAVSKDETGHYAQSCSTCRTGNEESVVAHTIKYGYTTKYTNSQHREYCTDCDYLITEACNYASDCEENCSECGLTTRVFFWEEHTLIYTTYIDGDDDSSNDCHDVRCANCSSLNYAVEFCYYAFACSEACVCGRANPNLVAHTEQITNESDGTHDRVCSVCAKVIAENIGHDLTYTASGNVITESCATENCTYSETATIGAEDTVYDGTIHPATVTYSENWVGGELTIVYSGTANDGSAYTTAPIDAGEAVASITVSGMTASVNYTVAKATNEWTQAPAIVGWTYGEYENAPTATPKFGKLDVTSFSYRLKGTLSWTNNPPSDAGIYEMRARVQASDNWELLITTIEFEVKKATPTADTFDFTLPTNLNACDGSAKEATVTVKEGIEGVGSVTIKYFKGETELTGAPTTVGTYTVKIEVAEGANFFKSKELLTDEAWIFAFDIIDEATHTGVTLVSNGNETHDKVCTVCEKVFKSGVACSYTIPRKDSINHWNECSDCGAIDEKIKHSATEDGDCKTEERCSCGTLVIEAKNDHDFDNACDTDCNNSGCKHTRFIVHEPTPDDGDCTTVIRCAICNEITTEAKEHSFDNNCDTTCNNKDCKHIRTITHTPDEDDDDCSTAIHCSICDAITTQSKAHDFTNACDTTCNNVGCKHTRFIVHEPTPDDGDCTTVIRCAICNEITTEAKEHSFNNTCDTTCNNKDCKHTRTITHTPDEDDGSCLTAVHCSVCDAITTPAKSHSFTNACDTSCNNTGCTHTRMIEHTPEDDDDDCTTDILCSICDAVTTKGKESHTGGSATCTAKAECTICGTKYGSTIAHSYTLPQKDSTDHWNKCSECDAIDRKVAHSGTDDGDCKTPVTCACGHVVAEAEDDHSFTDACDATCNNTGCVYTREITHVYDNACDADCNNCGAVREVGEHRYGEDNICDECGYEKQTESIPESSTPDESVPESSAPNDSEEETSSKEEGIKIGGCFSQMDGSVLFLLGLLTLAVAFKRKKA